MTNKHMRNALSLITSLTALPPPRAPMPVVPPRRSVLKVSMTPEVARQYRETIARNPPETFALLGGRLDNPLLITDFYFLPPIKQANGAYVQSAGYVYPDHDALNYIVDRALVPNGKYMLGLWHSHPGSFDQPSPQDFAYCSQIIANDDSAGRAWRYFIAPITTFSATGKDRIAVWLLEKGGSGFFDAVMADEHPPAVPLPANLQPILPADQPEAVLPRLSRIETSSPIEDQVAALGCPTVWSFVETYTAHAPRMSFHERHRIDSYLAMQAARMKSKLYLDKET